MNRGNLIIIGLTIAVLALFIFGVRRNAELERNIASSDEYTPADAAIFIEDSEELYKIIDNDRQYTALRRDLTTYRDLAVPTRESRKNSFSLVSEVDNQGDTIKLTGRFDALSDKISVTIKKLKNDRLETSITNLKTNGNIDSRLDSNSVENKFIATLPIDGDGYRIGYNIKSNSYDINLYSRSSTLLKKAEQTILDALEISDIDQVTVNYSVPTFSGGL